MKTAREFLEKEFHAFGNDELQLYITLNPDVKMIISAMENYAKQKEACVDNRWPSDWNGRQFHVLNEDGSIYCAGRFEKIN